MRRLKLAILLASLFLGSGNGTVDTAYAAAKGGAPSGGAPSGGGTPNGGAPSGGGTPNGGAPNGGMTSQGGAPNGGAPNGGAPNGGSPNGGSPNGGTTSQGGALSGGVAGALVMRRHHVGYPINGVSFRMMAFVALVCIVLLLSTGRSLNNLETELDEVRVKGT
jgi:hypothetical protein